MKEKHTVFLKKYLYRYIIFFIVFGLFVKIGNIFAQKQESVFIEQKIMLSAFQDPSLKTNKVRIRLRETSMNLLQFSKNNHVIGYAYLMDTQINNQKVMGWLIMNQDFQYMDFTIYYWEKHNEWVNLLHNRNLHQKFVQAITFETPLVWMVFQTRNIDFSEWRILMHNEEFVDSFNIFQEKASGILYSFTDLRSDWVGTTPILSKNTNR